MGLNGPDLARSGPTQPIISKKGYGEGQFLVVMQCTAGHAVGCPPLSGFGGRLSKLCMNKAKACLNRLHHEGHNVGVLLQLGLKGSQVIVGDGLKARHVGPKSPIALRVCTRQLIVFHWHKLYAVQQSNGEPMQVLLKTGELV